MKRFVILRVFTMLTFFLGFVVLAFAARGDTAFAAAQHIYVSAEVVSNTFDGSVLNECKNQYEIKTGKEHQIWISFGRVKPQTDQGWETVGSNTYCGDGSFEKAGAQLGLPYFIVDIETISTVGRAESIDLQMMLQIRKLMEFDDKGQPVYASSKQKRRFDLSKKDEAIVPLLLADERERERFNVHELFLRLKARVIGVEQASYGTISITADIPGADLLLDGGLVGRTIEKSTFVLRNVRVGEHEVRVKDLSRRTVWKQVTVKKDRTVNVSLNLLNLASQPAAQDLVSIGRNPEGYEEFWRARDGTVIVKVPAGEFLMGSAEGKGEPSEHPQHRVFVSDFLMDKTEVTWRQFRKFIEATGAQLPPEPPWGTPDDYPVASVLFNQAKAYCEWAGGRLPTEAEWEKAARGADGREYPWGNLWDQDLCNTLNGGPHRPEAVGSFPDCLSPYGLVDMAGSLWEWCADWYAEDYPEGPARDPKGPQSGTLKVLRGGSWISMSPFVRTAHRGKNDPFWRNIHNDNGFRCVQSIPPATGSLDTGLGTAPGESAKNVRVEGLPSTDTIVAPARLVSISIGAFANAIEEGRELKCDASRKVANGEQTEWWVMIGEAKPNPQVGWEGVSDAIRCGEGSFEKSNAFPRGSLQTPYLIATMSSMIAVSPDPIGPDKLLRLELSLTLRKLSGYSATGEPHYEQLPEKRTLIFVDRGTAFLPLMIADEKERKAFELQEGLMKMQLTLAGEEGRALYGALSISSDMEGAELRLDGGLVGRVSAGKETALTNIPVGEHEVSVSDSHGRKVYRVVRVEQNRTAMVSLKLPDKGRNLVPFHLVSQGKNTRGYEEYRREMDEAVVVKIPAGEFLMGNRKTEMPTLEHKVYASTFLMDKTAVTWSQFKKFAGATGASLPPNLPYWGIHDNHPAVFVTWEEARGYCQWAGGRLPTEAEREKAARGMDGRKYPWGEEEPNPQRAVFRGYWGNRATDSVGARPSGASPYGLLDMGGNVWEYVSDWYDPKYYEMSPRRDPKGPRTGQAHVVRGGSWDSRPIVLMTASRNFAYRGYREGDFGFRCAMDYRD